MLKAILNVKIIAIIIVIVLVATVVAVALPSGGGFGFGGKKVKVYGVANAAGKGWDPADYWFGTKEYLVTDDPDVLTFNLLWVTRMAYVEGELLNSVTGKRYTASSGDIGTFDFGALGWGQDDQPFDIYFRHVETSEHPYTATIKLYIAPEVLWGSPSLVAQATLTNIMVEE